MVVRELDDQWQIQILLIYKFIYSSIGAMVQTPANNVSVLDTVVNELVVVLDIVIVDCELADFVRHG